MLFIGSNSGERKPRTLLGRILQSQLMGYFLAGLRQEVRNLIRPHDPADLMRAMELARDIELAMPKGRAPTVSPYRQVYPNSRSVGGISAIHYLASSIVSTNQGTGSSGRMLQPTDQISPVRHKDRAKAQHQAFDHVT